MAQAERDVRVFRWDSDTVRWTATAVAMFFTDVIVGLAARWWVTVYVVMLSVSLFVADRLRYWLERKIELLMRAGNEGS